MKDRKIFVVIMSLGFLGLAIIAVFLFFIYWLVASFLVDTALGIHNLEGFVLKIIIVILIYGLIKGIKVLRQKMS